jgi:hypothetical protein
MSDMISETTSKSWFKRLGEALSGAVFGLFLFIAAIVLLFWNEGRSVDTARALAEGAGLVQSIDPAGNVSPFSGKLVHFSGSLVPVGVAADTDFPGIAAPAGATALHRTVEMYQWRETSKSETRTKIGGGEETVTTYSYDKVWSEAPINSSSFKQPAGHENPAMPSFASRSFSVRSGKIGTVTLDGGQFESLGDSVSVVPDAAMMTAIRSGIGGNRIILREGSYVTAREPGASAKGNIGTLRVSYMAGDVETLSAIGKLEGDRLAGFRTSNGRELLMVREGAIPAQEMFADAVSSNKILTWILRFGGFLAMMIGLRMVFAVIGVAGDVIPFLGSIFRFATGLAAFAIASLVSSVVIGIAWLYFRPLVGASIIGAGIVIAIIALRMGKSKAGKAAASQSAG